MKKVFLRADGNHSIGMGHVSRMLALGEMLQEEFKIKLVSRNEIETSFPTVWIKEETDFLDILDQNSIAVLDGYDFSIDLHQDIKKKQAKLVCIDDHQHQQYFADLVINHAPGINEDWIKSRKDTKYLLGPEYAMLRKPFREISNSEIKALENHVFVSFGGSDIHDLSYQFVQILMSHSDNVHVNLVLGKNYNGACLQMNDSRLSTYIGLSAMEMREIMRKCYLGVVSSSTILFECLSQGLKCVSGYYVDNQINIYDGFLRMNLIVGIGNLREITKLELNNAMEKATQLPLKDQINLIFDGKVKERIVAEFKKL